MTCPNCGYCPHCGRSAAPWYGWPYHPHYQYPVPFFRPFVTPTYPFGTTTGDPLGPYTFTVSGGQFQNATTTIAPPPVTTNTSFTLT